MWNEVIGMRIYEVGSDNEPRPDWVNVSCKLRKGDYVVAEDDLSQIIVLPSHHPYNAWSWLNENSELIVLIAFFLFVYSCIK